MKNFARCDVAIEIRHAVRQAASAGSVFGIVRETLFVKLLGPGLHRNFNAIRAEVFEVFTGRHAPDSREVRLSVGQLWGRRFQVGFAVGSTRNFRIRIVQPLRSQKKHQRKYLHWRASM